jgi:hypothetical protein
MELQDQPLVDILQVEEVVEFIKVVLRVQVVLEVVVLEVQLEEITQEIMQHPIQVVEEVEQQNNLLIHQAVMAVQE